MRVLFVASEMAPIAKIGGLGDVIGSLPKALRKLGVDARVIIPRYKQISKKSLKLVRRIDSRTHLYFKKVGGVPVYFIDNAKYLSRGPIYFERTAFADSKKEIERFKFFSQAVFELLRRDILKTDIIHANDWHAGFLTKLLKSNFQTPKVIFTIHNLANQGKWDPSASSGQAENFMAEGIKNSDFITTVSQTYAKEILTKEYNEGLGGLLKKRSREKRLIGILNGVDYSFWKKTSNRYGYGSPHFGLVSRLTYQKGIDLVTPLVGEFIKKYNAKFWFLGQGEQQYENALRKLFKQYPKNVFVKIGFDEKLAHCIYRKSDFFLMPSRFEPSGLGQMISMHYGTIPIVRATGGLKDTVRHLKTGFVFKKSASEALRIAMETAADLYFNQPRRLEKIRKNCLRQDFSWDKSAWQYRKLYLSLTK